MRFWIFIVTEHEVEGEIFTPETVFRQRMQDKFWGLGKDTPNRTSLQKGDEVVFYLGKPRKVFAGSAALSSNSFELTEDQKDNVSHGKKFYRPLYGVWLDNIQIWDRPKPVEELVPALKLIENKRFWFSYFQGGVRPILEEDFRTIVGGRETALVQQIGVPVDVESPSEFAMEAHLEEFIATNWGSIDFGSRLTLYKSDDQDGRQFPAGPWSIDFLCLDRDSGSLVVVELKRGKSSDSTVGQVLRYMTWVEENLAKPGQEVRGIIIASEMDDALRYAVKRLGNVAVLTYRVDFKLLPTRK